MRLFGGAFIKVIMSISGPIAPYSNVPIQPDFYKPRVFDISNISRGANTTVTTSSEHDYVVGQEVRFHIPQPFGMEQINGLTGFVTSVPSDNQVVVDIDSRQFNSFIPTPYTSTITNATQSSPCVLTTNNYFLRGITVIITDVEGMTELNENNYRVLSVSSSSITLDVNSSSFSAYSSGGTVTIYPTKTQMAQIAAIGTVRTGTSENSDINSLRTYIPGSFINIS